MASIASLGVGSNLDLSSLLDKIRTFESQPLLLTRQRQSSYNAKLSAYGQLKSLLSSFQTPAGRLTDTAFFQSLKAASSAADVLSATASSAAAAGTYAIDVTQLAQAHSLAASGVVGTGTIIGGGTATTVTIDFGTVTGTFNAATGKYDPGATFNPDAARPPVSLTIDSTNNTLTGIRDTINETPDIGVTASIVNDGTADRLVLTSIETGLASSMRIAVTGDAAVQSLLANDPTATQNMQQTAAAADANLTVNGIAVTSATNTVGTAIQGVSLVLAKIGSSTVTVQRDTAAVEGAINDFVKAYNSLHTTAAQMTKYDPAADVKGTLLGDSALRTIQTRIRSLLNTPQAGGTLTTLSQIGVSFQADGTLAVDSAKLAGALKDDLDGVAALFSGVDGSGGYGRQMGSLISGFNDANGVLTATTDGVNKTLRLLDKQYLVLQERIDATMERYRKQFEQLDSLLSGMNHTSSYLTQQFNALNSSPSKK